MERAAEPTSGWIVALAVVVVASADVLTTALFAIGCGVGENSPESVDFCNSGLPLLPLAGVVCAVGGGIAARTTRRDWPWIAGCSAAFLLALSLWVVRGDPAGNF